MAGSDVGFDVLGKVGPPVASTNILDCLRYTGMPCEVMIVMDAGDEESKVLVVRDVDCAIAEEETLWGTRVSVAGRGRSIVVDILKDVFGEVVVLETVPNLGGYDDGIKDEIGEELGWLEKNLAVLRVGVSVTSIGTARVDVATACKRVGLGAQASRSIVDDEPLFF